MVAPSTSVLLILIRKARKLVFHCWLVFSVQLIVNLDVNCHLFAQRINTDSLQIILSAQSKSEQLRTFRMLADAFREVNPKRAVGVAIRALQVAKELDSQPDIIHFELLLGSLYTQTKADTIARRHLQQGLDHAIAQGNDSLIAKGSLELGRHYLSIDDPGNAITLLNKTLELTDERHHRRMAAEANGAMGDAYKALGIYQNATEYYVKALRLTEALRDEQINALKAQHDTEKKNMAMRALQHEEQIANARRNNYILGAAVILLIVGGVYVNRRMKTKPKPQLLEKEQEVGGNI